MNESAILHGRKIESQDPVESLSSLLLRVGASHPERGITYIASGERQEFVSYPRLIETARRYLRSLNKMGIRAGDKVIIEVDEAKEFFFVFWACIFGGIVPAPIAQPTSYDHLSRGIDKLKNIWSALGRPLVIVDQRNQFSYEVLQTSQAFPQLRFCSTQDLQSEQIGELHHPALDQLAFLQYSSGSTGFPRGVTLTHRNLYANNAAISMGSEMCSTDTVCTWLPHTHDMGLIGQHILAIFKGNSIVKFSPATFVRTPLLYLRTFAEHRATWTCCPNFGLDWMSQRIRDEDLATLDLSTLRLIFNGAEPISVSVMERFMNKFAKAGLSPRSMFPVYGMAEATLAVAFPTYGELPIVSNFSRSDLVKGTIAKGSQQDGDKNSVEIVSEGWPVAGMSIRIADDDNNFVAENVVGEIQLKGPAVTSSYYNNAEENEACFADGWFKTGDVGFLFDGRLYVNGRIKDIVIVRGLKYHAHDIEEAAYAVEEIPRGSLAIVGHFNHLSQREELLAFVKHKGSVSDFMPVQEKIRNHVTSALRLELSHVIPVSKIPKTTSGKVRRAELRTNYESGEYRSVIDELWNLAAQKTR